MTLTPHVAKTVSVLIGSEAFSSPGRWWNAGGMTQTAVVVHDVETLRFLLSASSATPRRGTMLLSDITEGPHVAGAIASVHVVISLQRQQKNCQIFPQSLDPVRLYHNV